MEYKYSYLLGKSTKIDKSDKYSDYENFVMYLAPYDLSGVNICQNASKGCAAACLNTSGRGKFDSTQKARLNRTLDYLNNRKHFMSRLEDEIDKHHLKYPKLAIRLNGTSDINWIPFIRKMHKEYPDIVFYDYTKNPKIAKRAKNLVYYHVTFSRSEENDDICLEMLQNNINVAVVFRKELPKTWWGYPVIDGDVSDTRFLDAQGVVVGLRAKGLGKKDDSGFVIDYKGGFGIAPDADIELMNWSRFVTKIKNYKV